MKFKYTHRFDVDVDRLIAAMFDPALPAVLTEQMSTVRHIEVLERQETDTEIRRRVKYVPVPMIKKIGPKTITPESMEWVEESRFDKHRKVLSFENIPTHPKVRAKMTNHGEVTFRELGPQSSERTTSGELKVKFPLLGRIAEGVIAKNAKSILDDEARVLADFMKR